MPLGTPWEAARRPGRRIKGFDRFSPSHPPDAAVNGVRLRKHALKSDRPVPGQGDPGGRRTREPARDVPARSRNGSELEPPWLGQGGRVYYSVINFQLPRRTPPLRCNQLPAGKARRAARHDSGLRRSGRPCRSWFFSLPDEPRPKISGYVLSASWSAV
jgi:hypothetical protein